MGDTNKRQASAEIEVTPETIVEKIGRFDAARLKKAAIADRISIGMCQEAVAEYYRWEEDNGLGPGDEGLIDPVAELVSRIYQIMEVTRRSEAPCRARLLGRNATPSDE